MFLSSKIKCSKTLLTIKKLKQNDSKDSNLIHTWTWLYKILKQETELFSIICKYIYI